MSTYHYITINPRRAPLSEVLDANSEYTKGVTRELAIADAGSNLLVAAKCAYTILADIRHNWSGRHSPEGQATLIVLRDSIAAAEGRNPEEVQDEYSTSAAKNR